MIRVKGRVDLPQDAAIDKLRALKYRLGIGTQLKP
jgi:hypothetical protein